MSDFLFYILATLLVTLSFLVVSLPNLLHSAIALIGSFFITAALYIMLQLEFLALAQLMLYIGGIVVFMLIVILLTTGLGVDNRLSRVSAGKWISRGVITGAMLFSLLYFFSENPACLLAPSAQQAGAVTIDQIGIRLLSTNNGFIVPFEVVSLLLLVALVGAVVIARKDVKKEEQQ